VNLSIDQLDTKYPRIIKSSRAYGIGIAVAAILFGAAPTILGLVVLVREFSTGRQ